MAPSCRQAFLQGAAALSVARKLAASGSRGFASSFRRFYRSSSFISSKTNTPTPSFVNPRATLAPDVLVPAPPTPDTSVLAPSTLAATPVAMPTADLFWQFMQAYIEDRQNLVPALAFLPTKVRENALDRLLKAKNPDLYYSNLYMECYNFCQ